MSDPRMIARLADLREFAELRQYFEQKKDDEIAALGRKSFAKPADHDVLEWEKLRAYYRGVEAVMQLPVSLRDGQKKESHV